MAKEKSRERRLKRMMRSLNQYKNQSLTKVSEFLSEKDEEGNITKPVYILTQKGRLEKRIYNLMSNK